MPALPARATKLKFYNLATRPEAFFVREGDELDYNSSLVSKPGTQPVLISGTWPLVANRVRVKRDAEGRAMRQAPEAWLWEWHNPNQQGEDGGEQWVELGYFSGPKDLEKKLLDFFARDFGHDVTGPRGALQDGRGSWERFVFRRPGELPKSVAAVREEYWRAKKEEQEQREQQQQHQQQQQPQHQQQQ
ncbi:uncharacterized protein Z520_03767 [Fonsecaea multimorphosa CBS 102226]|uniref:Uncharacterized protein n=1 Tax=Fonsecaea multimorphosa CBS 102226 TaxID=1442371 RepID=A0A0D2ISZ5_9EURO|nr:uncharacterized protein Z520_03767 [Fonsecaea multimorphosa CBS 102226]KIY00082.1 hypothetical protein Z520_03767 [Fonsecaea multimorphosa CBS 102226]OAL27279.1 hypothetical protein AYO22_03554 [Fonsecaea multimorphosa]